MGGVFIQKMLEHQGEGLKEKSSYFWIRNVAQYAAEKLFS